VPWFAVIIFYNIAHVGEIEPIGNGAKGIRLQDLRRDRVRNSWVLVFTKKEKRRKIEAAHRKLKPEIRKILFGMGLLE
jgi:hypothetical protein